MLIFLRTLDRVLGYFFLFIKDWLVFKIIKKFFFWVLTWFSVRLIILFYKIVCKLLVNLKKKPVKTILAIIKIFINKNNNTIKSFLNFNNKITYIFFDYIYFFFFFRKQLLNFKVNYKEKQLNLNIYKNIGNQYNFNFFIYFFKNIFLFIRFWLVSFFLFIIIVYYFLIFRSLPFNKILFEWFIIIMVAYWVVSGFVFFLKKYRFGKFTSSIQRFWRRSFMIFWLIESFLFLIFIYLTLNANNESTFMYDNSQFYKNHLFSWRWFLLKIFPLTLLVIFSYIFLISFKWLHFSKVNLYLLLFTLLLLYVLWLEFYQFYFILNFYGTLSWVYDSTDHLWVLESDFKKTRIVNHYVTIAIIAKFWHLIFIFLFWVFFLLRSNEFNRYRYPFFSANLQNFIMLYILSWIYMYPWLKFFIRRFLDNPYYWFYVNTRRNFFRIFFNDLKLFYFGFCESAFVSFYRFNFIDYYYYFSTSFFNNYSQYKKNILRDYFILNVFN